MTGPDGWIATVAADSIDLEYPSMAKLPQGEVALCRVDGDVFAIDNICTHAFARLSDGFVEGNEVFCPLHQGSFDVRTGAAIAAPCFEPIRCFATQIRDGVVYVSIEPKA